MSELLRLPPDVEEKVMQMGEHSYGATLVTLTLRSGKRIDNVVMAGGMYLCWVEGREIEKEEDLDFALADVTDAMQQRGYV
jgi:hypothetical protein